VLSDSIFCAVRMVILSTLASMLVSIKKMKWLSKKILLTSKFLLLFNLTVGVASALELVSSDRFLLKIVDRAVSVQDIQFQIRNLKALNCLYPDALLVAYFEKKFITEIEQIILSPSAKNSELNEKLQGKLELIKKLRIFLKLMRYAEDQNQILSTDLVKLIREGSLANRCQTDVLYGDDLKTNFKTLIQAELFLRARYKGQAKGKVRNIDVIRPSIDLFLDSLDKQFSHEYFW
jgi:hypothetical protein